MKYTVESLYLLWANEEQYGPIYELVDYWMRIVDSIDETLRTVNGIDHESIRHDDDDEARLNIMLKLLADALNYAAEQAVKDSCGTRREAELVKQINHLKLYGPDDDRDPSNFVGQHATCSVCHANPELGLCAPCKHNRHFIHRLFSRVAKAEGAAKKATKDILTQTKETLSFYANPGCNGYSDDYGPSRPGWTAPGRRARKTLQMIDNYIDEYEI